MCIKSLVLGAHLVSYHTGDGYNNLNPGLNASFCKFQSGIYYNSNKKVSVYSAREFSHKKIFLLVGGVSGYNKKITPFSMIGVRVDKFKIGFIPKIKGKSNTNLIHVMYEF
jgi:hypothetical protein